jgi:hypothetical protein
MTATWNGVTKKSVIFSDGLPKIMTGKVEFTLAVHSLLALMSLQ